MAVKISGPSLPEHVPGAAIRELRFKLQRPDLASGAVPLFSCRGEQGLAWPQCITHPSAGSCCPALSTPGHSRAEVRSAS
eukprot:scaffold117165_cov26-Tisochrysis_lutea.AAC.1